MTRRFELGPLLVVLAAVLLLVSLFLDWYGRLSAWDAFEVTDILLAALAVGALLTALAMLLPDVAYLERRALPWLVAAVVVLVAAELIDPPPAAVGRQTSEGAWLAFAAACLMLIGTVLAFGRVSLAVAVEGRDMRRRVAAVDHRPPPTETGSMVAVSRDRPAETRPAEPLLHRREAEGEGE